MEGVLTFSLNDIYVLHGFALSSRWNMILVTLFLRSLLRIERTSTNGRAWEADEES